MLVPDGMVTKLKQVEFGGSVMAEECFGANDLHGRTPRLRGPQPQEWWGQNMEPLLVPEFGFCRLPKKSVLMTVCSSNLLQKQQATRVSAKTLVGPLSCFLPCSRGLFLLLGPLMLNMYI